MAISFVELYNRYPSLTASAPGRVNLIGEHTDYNDGFVLPAALPLETTVELAPRRDRTVRVWSTEFPGEAARHFSLDTIARADDWTDYVRGITSVMLGCGLTRGFDAIVSSTIPPGSGLSSSAALLVAVARALRASFQLPIDDLELARLAHRAETAFVGAPVGIMDQMVCSLGDDSSALFIDTRTLAWERIAVPATAALLVIDSGVRHSHVSGDYRLRREECARAAIALGVGTLRDVGERDLSAIDALPEPLNRRARHVVTENARVVAAVAAFRSADLGEAGRLFRASHASMRDDYDVSTPLIDALVRTAQATSGVYGARLTGGGFGGAIVALTEAGRATEIGEAVVAHHNRHFPTRATVVVPETRIPDSAIQES